LAATGSAVWRRSPRRSHAADVKDPPSQYPSAGPRAKQAHRRPHAPAATGADGHRSDIRAQLDFEINVLGEVWIEMIAARLGVDVREVHEKVADRMAAARARQNAAETGGGTLTGDPTLDTQYLRSGVHGAPRQHPSAL
jgi:hypothetical protein